MRAGSAILSGASIAVAALVLRVAAGDVAGPPRARVEVIEAYKSAKQARDSERIAACLAPDARMWFEKREGPGRPIRRDTGGGPWAEWDRYFRASSRRVGEYEGGDEWVRVRVEETNDYYRLLDRPPKRHDATYFFDADGRIEGILIAGVPQEEGSRGRYDAFETWARQAHPGALEALMPEGDIVPSLANARSWRALLVEWRTAAGLEPVDLGGE